MTTATGPRHDLTQSSSQTNIVCRDDFPINFEKLATAMTAIFGLSVAIVVSKVFYSTRPSVQIHATKILYKQMTSEREFIQKAKNAFKALFFLNFATLSCRMICQKNDFV